VVTRFGLDATRYVEFSYLCYLNLDDKFVQNYVQFHLGTEKPIIVGRIKAHADFWEKLHPPPWLMDTIRGGVKVPFDNLPPRIVLPNNKSAVTREIIPWVRSTIKEYLEFGFIEEVAEIPFCVSPLQVKDTGGKLALICDMSLLNDYVQKAKFKLEDWEVMFHYSRDAAYGIKFDLKKFYHEIDICPADQKYFGFMYKMDPEQDAKYFVWKTLPYGYTRAPFIARALMKPLIAKWRRLGGLVVVFYDDGMLVSKDREFLEKLAIEVQCDLLEAGLVPGVDKCIWSPVQVLAWNGLQFDFVQMGIRILEKRIRLTTECIMCLLALWPKVTFRQIAKVVGQLGSMHPVMRGITQIRTKMLQTFVNIRHYKNLSWEGLIVADYPPLFLEAKKELRFWLDHILNKNFRPFQEQAAQVIAWVDASDVAIGGFAARLLADMPSTVPLTADNWLLDGGGALRRLHSSVTLQADVVPWQEPPHVQVRDMADLNPALVRKTFFVHRNLDYAERAVDSNERELLAAVQLLRSCGRYWSGLTVTLYFDNMNAAIITTKGSQKPRLQKYAVQIFELTQKLKIELHAIWIPRDLNFVADSISRVIDFDDHAVTSEFFTQVCGVTGVTPGVDRFADDRNKKLPVFFSAVYSPGTRGVDAFNFAWNDAVNWIFPPVKLIARALYHLKATKAAALFLVPQWKNSYYYPILLQQKCQPCFRGCWVFSGPNMFLQGADASSFFGPHFKGNVEIWYLNYTLY